MVSESERIWPECVWLKLNSLSEVNLKDLSNELRVVVQSAIHKIISWIIFRDPFPSIILRAEWNQTALLEAAGEFMECSREPLKGFYGDIQGRVNEDPNFVKIIGRLVHNRSFLLLY